MTTTVSPTSDVCLYFLAIFLPPVSVFFKVGFGADFWINILLCILAFIPGIIHAWYVISRSEGAMGPTRHYAPATTTATTAPATTGFTHKTPVAAPGTTGYGATGATTGNIGAGAGAPVY